MKLIWIFNRAYASRSDANRVTKESYYTLMHMLVDFEDASEFIMVDNLRLYHKTIVQEAANRQYSFELMVTYAHWLFPQMLSQLIYFDVF